MQRLKLTVVFLSGILLSCGTAPKTDPLEAKAQAGDPIAACRLAARDLHACALQKTAGNDAILTESLACYDTALDDRKQGYLEAGKKLYAARSPGAECRYFLMIVRLTLAAAGLPISSAQRAQEDTAALEQACADLEK